MNQFPCLSETSYTDLELLARLRKAPEVKRLLNKDWKLDSKPKKGGGMFDDLDDYDSEGEPKSESEPEQAETITVQP